MKTGELPIKSPCAADWASMNPRATGRFCADCKKVVHDLSSMREADARKRVAAAPEGLCIRYLHDEHGNIWFKDTPLVSPGSLLKKTATFAAIALMPVLTACMGGADDDDDAIALPLPPPGSARDAATDGPRRDASGADGRTNANPAVGDGRADGGSRSDADADADASDAQPDAEADGDAG